MIYIYLLLHFIICSLFPFFITIILLYWSSEKLFLGLNFSFFLLVFCSTPKVMSFFLITSSKNWLNVREYRIFDKKIDWFLLYFSLLDLAIKLFLHSNSSYNNFRFAITMIFFCCNSHYISYIDLLNKDNLEFFISFSMSYELFIDPVLLFAIISS